MELIYFRESTKERNQKKERREEKKSSVWLFRVSKSPSQSILKLSVSPLQGVPITVKDLA